MLNGNPINRDALGRLVTVSPGVPISFNGGTPMASLGDLQVILTGGTVRNGGLLYDDEGHLVIDGAGAITGHVQGGLPVILTGAMAVEVAGVPVSFNAGIPISATGRVCIVNPVSPTNFFAFSDAFSGAFDSPDAP